MKMSDIGKSKTEHDTRVSDGYQIQPGPPTKTDTSWECLNDNRKRMDLSLSMNALDKSFQQALDTAEGTEVFTVWEKGDKEQWKVILRNMKDNWQTDSKYISAPLGQGFQVGNTLTWVRTGIRWLVVWQDLNINEFFRGEIQRANHVIRWKNKNGVIQQQWAAVQGPVETRAKYEQTRGNVITGRQNDTVEIWMGANEGKQIVESLERFDRIRISNRTWLIQVRDDISNPEILRFTCVEDFNNDATDDMIELIPGGKIDFAPNEEEPIDEKPRIVGPALVRQKLVSHFTAVDSKENPIEGTWVVDGATVVETTTSMVSIKGIKIGQAISVMFTDTKGNSNIVTAKTISMLS